MIKVGCCGYPVSRNKYYNFFDVIEIQSTFYKLPMVKTAIRWREEAPPNIEFIVKAWQAITHPWGMPTWRRYGKTPPPGELDNYGYLRYTVENIDAWRRIDEVRKALNTDKVLIQLPPKLSISNKNIDEIRRFLLEIGRGDVHLILEPRHDSWEHSMVKRLFEELDIVHCVDPFKGRPWRTGGFYYLRLHGINGYNYGYKYTDDDLLKLSEFISKLRPKKATYVMFNNKYMFEDALRFKNIIND